jgi:hypothetical protein
MDDAINKGFKMSSGEIMSWLNSDDMYFPWAVEIVVKAMARKKVNWVTGIKGNWTANGIHYNLPIIVPLYSKLLIKNSL